MGYVGTGATKAGFTVMTPERIAATLCGAGKVWCPPAAGKAGYCARKRADGQNPCGPVNGAVTVRETPADAERKKCSAFRGEAWKECISWVGAGRPYDDFAIAKLCADRGYTGQSLEVCIDGRKQGIPFSEIDKVIAELAAQASAAEQAQIAQEQALVASRKRRKLLILGGLGAAALAGLIIWKKRRKKPAAK
ncbi:MAG: hypothetical protein ACYSWU_00080 [Planctomycetota bacterium]|jgi:hypothetical protein